MTWSSHEDRQLYTIPELEVETWRSTCSNKKFKFSIKVKGTNEGLVYTGDYFPHHSMHNGLYELYVYLRDNIKKYEDDPDTLET